MDNALAHRFAMPADHVLHRIQRGALIAGVAALGVSAMGGFLNPAQFFQSYLVAYLFWFGITLGCLAILMIHHIAGGAWGAVIRRILESATRTIPILALLFLPILLGVRELYEWAKPEHVAHDPILLKKSVYLNVPFFAARAALYFAIWFIVEHFLNRWSSEQDRDPESGVTRRLELLSRGGLVLYGLTVSFASIDWVMSLEPHWFSTIYGLLFMGSQGIAAFAFVIPVAALLVSSGPLAGVVKPRQFHDLGNLLLAFVMIWTYLSFSQLLIIWAGNLPEEIPWVLRRWQGGWRWVALAVLGLSFVLPFIILLSRGLKRNARLLAMVALGVIAMRLVDLFWLVAPAFRQADPWLHWLDLLTPIGVGGIWLWQFLRELATRPLLPLGDPSLPEIG